MKLTKKQEFWLGQLQKHGNLTTPPNSAHDATFKSLVKKGVARVVVVKNGFTTYKALS